MVDDSSQGAAPSDEEIGQAILEAARYGDVEDLKGLVSVYGRRHVNFKGYNTNSALHQGIIRMWLRWCVDPNTASANGHAECVEWLLRHGASFEANDSGNTPLHWAVQNNQCGVVEMLLTKVQNIDVLARNGFGKSALTEAFGGRSPELLRLILEHSSANEEALLGEGHGDTSAVREGGGEDKEERGDDSSRAKVHRLVLDSTRPERVLQIRELAIAHPDDPFGKEARDDTTGLGLWSAALVLARWLVDHTERLGLGAASRVCELGAGCGLPGLAVALHAQPKHVVLTDYHPETVANLRHNVELNIKEGIPPRVQVEATSMDWADEQTWPSDPVDMLLGSDLVYQGSMVHVLINVINKLLRAGGVFLYVAPVIGRDGLEDFIEGLSADAGLDLRRKAVAPDSYVTTSPLEGGAFDEFMLHFHELAAGQTRYCIYEFIKE